MKLKKIFFDAFKSLLKKELEINCQCIGLVGINESGKSNILSAVNILSGARKLSISDTPKMDKRSDPSLRFVFELTEKEKKDFKNLIVEWEKLKTLNTNSFTFSENEIVYTVKFNKEKDIEERFFSIKDLRLKDDFLILLWDKQNDPSKIKNGDLFNPLSKSIIINQNDLTNTIDHHNKVSEHLDSIKEDVSQLEAYIHEDRMRLLDVSEHNPEKLLAKEKGTETQKLKMSIRLKEDSLSFKKKELQKLESYNLQNIIDDANNLISIGDGEIASLSDELANIQLRIDDLNASERDEALENELQAALGNLNVINGRISPIKLKNIDTQNVLEHLSQPIQEKYTNNETELIKYFGEQIQNHFNPLLPKSVFWEYNSNYILASETAFSELINKKDLNDISRPLVNVFRIGLGIKTIDDLKSKISEIQAVSNERSRIERTLNTNINAYLKRVWKEYDQEMNITLERDQIRIEIFDPIHKQASYYSMQERSQGCQTFLSFLLTIGAEAEHGVIVDTILLLDEPETHLHPSGVRFMLQELIKISEKGNLVIYATHSIFLIDRKNFDRHIIVKKNKEHTVIKPAIDGRIGYFMQEEVLYGALDLDLSNEFSSTNTYNFVFEGDGDVVLFRNFYEKILSAKPFKMEQASFYHGGKCSDIEKYLNQKPIQLGSKWIFILDKDKPAAGLKKFIEGKYKDYMNKDIYVFQYLVDDSKLKDEEIEFEDLLEKSFLQEVFVEVFEKSDIKIDIQKVEKLLKGVRIFSNILQSIIETYVPNDQKEEFKGKFKGCLNQRIKNAAEDSEFQNKFSETFPKYSDWASTVISALTLENLATKKEKKTA
jgi:predicted ATP-dependent endonuclease of OLD family